MKNKNSLWNKAFKLEEEAEALQQSDQSYTAHIKCSELYQQAGRLREKAAST